MPKFCIKIGKAEGLTACADGSADCFVKLRLGVQKKRTTKTILQTVNPVFNEWFDYAYWQKTDILELSVWNRRPEGVDPDFMGRIGFDFPSDPTGHYKATVKLMPDATGKTVTGTLSIEIVDVAQARKAKGREGPSPHSVVAQPAEDVGEPATKRMRGGEQFTHHENGETSEVMVYWSEYGGPMGELIWVLPGTNPETASSRHRLPMHQVTDVFIGLPCPHARQVPNPDVCLTMKGKNNMANLVAPSTEVLEAWLDGIKYILMSRGKKVVQNDAKPDQVASTKKGRRFTVTGQNPRTELASGPTYAGDDSTPQLKMMLSGCPMKGYENEDNPTITPIFVFFSKNGGKFGSIFWCPPGEKKEDPTRVLRVHELTDIYVGKQRPIFKHAIAKDVEDQRCFSIVSKSKTLHVEAISVQVMKDWMVGINHVLTSTGRKVVLENEAGEKKATPAGRRFSRHFSVAVRSKTTHKGVLKMAKGALFTRYRLKKSNTSRSVKTQVFVFHSRLVAQESTNANQTNTGALFWYEKKDTDMEDEQKTRDRSCMPIHSITDIFLGKQNEIFQTKCANAAKDDCVISIVGVVITKRGKQSEFDLHLEAESPEVAAEWMEAITHLLEQAGRGMDAMEPEYKVPTADDAGDTLAAPTAKKGKRMSVVNKPKDPEADPFELLGVDDSAPIGATVDDLDNCFPESRPANPFAQEEKEEEWSPFNNEEEEGAWDPFAGDEEEGADPFAGFDDVGGGAGSYDPFSSGSSEAKTVSPNEEAGLSKLTPELQTYLKSQFEGEVLLILGKIFADELIVDVDTLKMFTLDDLKGLGVKAGPRVKITKTIATFKP